MRLTMLQKGMKNLREKVAELTRLNKEKDKRITQLETRLIDREAQRKELLSYLYEPRKKNGQSKPRGKRPGAPAYHRPTPKEEDVTERCIYNLVKCPMCTHPVGDAVDTVIKWEEDINLNPRPIIKKHTITRHWCSHCETYVKSKNIPDTSRIGINVMGYILYASL